MPLIDPLADGMLTLKNIVLGCLTMTTTQAVQVEVVPAPAVLTEEKRSDQQDKKEEESSCSSVDSEDAFLSFVGLRKKDEKEDLRDVMAMDEEEEREEEKVKRLNSNRIDLPPKCSRYGHAPSRCAAVTVDEFCSLEECESILQLARQSAAGFQYITEASHVAPDGSTYKGEFSNN